jgi:selenide,water dikinase
VAEILRGGVEKLREAGVALLGGHTVDDPEPKFGVAVTGTIDPGRIVTNAAARDGDVLVLTKALGTGIISTAIKAEAVPPAVAQAAIAQMAQLNAAAGAAMLEVGVSAATDVTGFGLLGHLWEMVSASGVGAELRAEAVPVLPGTWELLAQGYVPGGSRRNLAQLGERVSVAPDLPEGLPLLLADAQTSGGLLMAVPPDRVEALLRALDQRGIGGAVIGHLSAAAAGTIQVRP